MRGVVLGYEQAMSRGVISGDDGARYEFTTLQWRSPTPPRAGQPVDFAPQNGQAADIFLVGGAAYAGASQGPSFDFSNFVLRPPLVLALIILIGCFLPLIALPRSLLMLAAGFSGAFGAGMPINPNLNLSLLGLFDLISFAIASINAQAVSSMSYGGYPTPPPQTGGLYLLYLIYFIPILAVWVIISEVRRPDGASEALRTVTGLMAFAGLFVIPIVSLLVIASTNNQAAATGDILSNLKYITYVPLGLGGVMIMAGGGLLLLNAWGVISNPPPKIDVSTPEPAYGGGGYGPAPTPSYAPPTPVYAPPQPSNSSPQPAHAPPPYPTAPAYDARPLEPQYAAPYADVPRRDGFSLSGGRGFVFRPAFAIALLTLIGCALPLFVNSMSFPASLALYNAYETIQIAQQNTSYASAFYALYLIPAVALWILYAEASNQGGRGAPLAARLILAIAAFVAPAILFWLAPNFVSLEFVQPSLGPGAIMIAGAGALMLLSIIGLIPAPAPRRE